MKILLLIAFVNDTYCAVNAKYLSKYLLVCALYSTNVTCSEFVIKSGSTSFTVRSIRTPPIIR
jgi:hypothetical protein